MIYGEAIKLHSGDEVMDNLTEDILSICNITINNDDAENPFVVLGVIDIGGNYRITYNDEVK